MTAPARPRRAASKRQARSPEAVSDKRERILSAAIKVFASKGFYATRVSEIATAAGVADGTIYLYFKNKDDVLISIFDDRIGKLIETLRTEVAKHERHEDRIRAVIHLQLGLLEESRDLAEVVTVNLRQSSRLLKQYAAPSFVTYLDVVASVVADGQADGAFRRDVSPRTLARAIWGALDGILLTWALGDAKPEVLKKAGNQLATVLLAGLAEPGSRP